MSYPHMLNHGAIAGVTGSCHKLRMNSQRRLLILPFFHMLTSYRLYCACSLIDFNLPVLVI